MNFLFGAREEAPPDELRLEQYKNLTKNIIGAITGNLRGGLDGDIDIIGQDITDFADADADIPEELTQLIRSINSLEGKDYTNIRLNQDIRKGIVDLISKDLEINKKITEIIEKVEDKKDILNELKTNLAELQTNIFVNLQKQTKCDSYVTELEAQIRELQAQNTALEAQIAALRGQHEELTEQHEELTGQREALTTELTTTREQKDLLFNLVQMLKEKVEHLNTIMINREAGAGAGAAAAAEPRAAEQKYLKSRNKYFW